jgi:hypothetical protein
LHASTSTARSSGAISAGARSGGTAERLVILRDGESWHYAGFLLGRAGRAIKKSLPGKRLQKDRLPKQFTHLSAMVGRIDNPCLLPADPTDRHFMYSTIHAKRLFSNSSGRSSSTSTSDSRNQPKISVLKENRLEPRIDIHSIDYEFPLQTKKKESSGNPTLADENSKPVFSPKTNEGASAKSMTTPLGAAPVVVQSQKHEVEIGVDAENTIDSGDTSGMTVTSFIECIRWNDHAALEMHIEAGFKGDMAFVLDSVESNPIELAMECGNFDALTILLPRTKASVLMEAMNKRQEFFDQNVALAINLFCKL